MMKSIAILDSIRMHKNTTHTKKEEVFEPAKYIDKYNDDIDNFQNIDVSVKNKYQRYLDKARFQCESYTRKFDKARRLSSIYTKVSIVSSVLLLTLVMASSFKSLLGGYGELFPYDSIIYNLIKIIIVVAFSIASNLNLCTRPGVIKDIMRRKLIQLNSLLEETSDELISLEIEANKDDVLAILDKAFRRLNDMGYDGIDNDIDVEKKYY